MAVGSWVHVYMYMHAQVQEKEDEGSCKLQLHIVRVLTFLEGRGVQAAKRKLKHLLFLCGHMDECDCDQQLAK